MTKDKQIEEVKTGLYGKIVAVMSEVESVAKNGHNDYNNYDYSTEADILAAIRGSLIKHQLVILPSVRATSITKVIGEKGGEQQLTTLEMEYTIVDAENGESVTRGWAGQGQDKGDKGAYKAMTGAQKYFLLKTFLIATDDDPEKDAPAAKQPAKAAKPIQHEGAEPRHENEDEVLLKCEAAGKPAAERSGVNKSGKPYKGIFCSDKEGCGHVTWKSANS